MNEMIPVYVYAPPTVHVYGYSLIDVVKHWNFQTNPELRCLFEGLEHSVFGCKVFIHNKT